MGLRSSPAAGNPARPNNSCLPPQFTRGIREPSPLPLHGPGFLPSDWPFVAWRVDPRIEGAPLAVEMPPTGPREVTLSRSIPPVSGPCRIRLSVPSRNSVPPFPLLAGPPGVGSGFRFLAATSRLPDGKGMALLFSSARGPVVGNLASAAFGTPGPSGTGSVRRFVEY